MQCALYLEFIFSKQCIFSKIYLCAFQIIIGLHFNFATRWANTSYDIYSEIALLIVLNYVNRSTRKMVFIYWKNAFGVCRVYCALYKCTLYMSLHVPPFYGTKTIDYYWNAVIIAHFSGLGIQLTQMFAISNTWQVESIEIDKDGIKAQYSCFTCTRHASHLPLKFNLRQ